MKISIIVPMFNSERTIKKCIDSILHQTYQNIDVILIDDCSEDNTWVIAKQIKEKDSRISLYRNKKNIGAGLSRNIGIKYSTGNWITFCDADDYPEKNWILDFVTGINDNVEMIIQGFYCSNWPGEKTGRIIAYKGTSSRNIVIDALCKHHVFGYLWCKMYKSSIIKENDIHFKNITIEEDELFNLQYLKYVRKITCLSNCNYHYDYPNFYRKYGHIDNFKENIEMFLTACNSFGSEPMRIKDMYVELSSDWLISAYRQNLPDKVEKLSIYCTIILPYLPYAHSCRLFIRLLRYFIFPNSLKLSHIGMTFYVNTIGLLKK